MRQRSTYYLKYCYINLNDAKTWKFLKYSEQLS
jgi:hypothetical protein